MQKRLRPLIKSLSLRYQLPTDVIAAIVQSQFECAREETKKGISGKPETFMNIRWKHLGLLVAKPGRIAAIHKNNERRKQKREQEDGS